MKNDPLIVAARALALLWYVEHHKNINSAAADDWAQENFIPFLPDATELLGRSLMGDALTAEEQEEAEFDLAWAEASYKTRQA
jgi:hypothetical protein